MYIILLSLLLILIVIGYIIFKPKGSGNQEVKDISSLPQEQRALLDACLEIGVAEDREGRYGCLVDSVRQIDDPGICYYFSSSSPEYLLCSTVFAADLKDESYCEKMNKNLFPHQYSMCLRAIARIKEDESICDKITSQYTIKSKDGCFWDVAYAKSDTTICQNINDSVGVSYCERMWEPPKSEYDEYLSS